MQPARRGLNSLALLAGTGLLILLGVNLLPTSSVDGAIPDTSATTCTEETPTHAAEVLVRGGRFLMGSEQGYPEERPVREVKVGDFWIDIYAVTNAQFAAFVEATGYVTVAERGPDPADHPGIPADRLIPGSAVFHDPAAGALDPAARSWWQFTPGANWRAPEGPGSNLDSREHFPVVHVAFEDALAYAIWSGRDLPTEPEWEYAARAGGSQTRYAWGKELAPAGRHQANTWQGEFPLLDTGEDGYAGLAPVGCFPPNEFGIHDMIGNVWEWTTDAVPGREGFRVIKGGSYLCAPNYCSRYRPSARQFGEADLGTGHIGFRTVRRE